MRAEFEAWTDSARRSGLVAQDIAPDDFERGMYREAAMNKLDLLPIRCVTTPCSRCGGI
jgi:hypothetical protein